MTTLQLFKNDFSTDVYKLYESIIYNSFQHNKRVKINNISMTGNAEVDAALRILRSAGEKQHENFFQKRLILGKVAIGVPIKMNSFQIPGIIDANAKEEEKKTCLFFSCSLKYKRSCTLQSRTYQKCFFAVAIWSMTVYCTNK